MLRHTLEYRLMHMHIHKHIVKLKSHTHTYIHNAASLWEERVRVGSDFCLTRRHGSFSHQCKPKENQAISYGDCGLQW